MCFITTVAMNVITCLLLLATCLLAGAASPKNVWDFAKMITCVQPNVSAFDYNNYGCWCGLGGGGTPVDEVDGCCRVHDKCYEASMNSPQCTGLTDLPYIISYDYTCVNQRVYCSATNDVCANAVCECDRRAAHCFANNKYNPENKGLDKDVHCSGPDIHPTDFTITDI